MAQARLWPPAQAAPPCGPPMTARQERPPAHPRPLRMHTRHDWPAPARAPLKGWHGPPAITACAACAAYRCLPPPTAAQGAARALRHCTTPGGGWARAGHGGIFRACCLAKPQAPAATATGGCGANPASGRPALAGAAPASGGHRLHAAKGGRWRLSPSAGCIQFS